MNVVSATRGINRPLGKIDIPSAWLGAEMKAKPDRWLISLAAGEIAELESAAESYLGRSRKIADITKESFPLPRFGAHLEELKTKLLVGLGFEVIRGLRVANYSQELAATIFCGVGAHLGSARSQNAAGHILGHVRDIGADARDPNTRIYQTSERQTFHTDSSDVVGLLCIREAMEGGDSLLVSTTSIYNAMFDRRPDLAALLFDPIATDRRGEVPENEKPYLEIPVLNWHAGFLTGFYQRQYIDSAQRFPDAPRLTPAHVEALDLFDALAKRPRLAFWHAASAGRHAVRLQSCSVARPDRIPRLAGCRPKASFAAALAQHERRPTAARLLQAALWLDRDWQPRRHHHQRHQSERAAGLTVEVRLHRSRAFAPVASPARST